MDQPEVNKGPWLWMPFTLENLRTIKTTGDHKYVYSSTTVHQFLQYANDAWAFNLHADDTMKQEMKIGKRDEEVENNLSSYSIT